MALVNINAVATAANTSPDIVLADAASSIVHLVGDAAAVSLPAGCSASVQIKDSTGYKEVAVLTEKQPQLQIFGPATYRVVKKVGANAFGVDRD